MVDAAASRTSAEISRNRDLFPVIYERQGASLEESPYTGGEWVMRESPGASLRGPVRELGKFYEMLLRHGQTADGRELLSSRVLEKCFSRQRAGEFDRTFQHIVDFGLGWIVNSNRYGMQTIPYGFVDIRRTNHLVTEDHNARSDSVIPYGSLSWCGLPMGFVEKASISGGIER